MDSLIVVLAIALLVAVSVLGAVISDRREIDAAERDHVDARRRLLNELSRHGAGTRTDAADRPELTRRDDGVRWRRY